MARDLRLQIDGDSSGARKALDNVADESDKTAATLRGLAAEMKQAARDGGHLEGQLKDVGGSAVKAGDSIYVMGRQVDKAADEMKAAARAAEKLDAELAVTRAEIAKLKREFADTGDVEVLTTIQKQYAQLDRISRVKKRIAKDDEDERKRAKAAAEEAKNALERAAYLGKRDKRGTFGNVAADLFGIGKSVFGKTTAGATQAATNLNEVTGKLPFGTLAKVGLGVSAAPGILGAAGGLTLAGGALAGVGLGVGGAIANNPAPFRDAWERAITDVSRRWQSASSGFEKPALTAFQTLKSAVDDIHLEKMLAAAQKYVQPLATGIGGFITPLANGIEKLVDKAGPVVTVLEKDLPMLGKAFETAFGDIGDGAGGAAGALDDLISIIGTAVIAFGKLVKVGSDFYSWGEKNLPLLGAHETAVTSVGRALDSTTPKMQHYVTTQKDLADFALAAADAQRQEFGIMLSAGEAADRATEATAKLNETLKDNGYVISGNSEKALANREIIRNTIRDWQDEATTAAEAGGNTREAINKANEVLLKHLEDLRAVLKAHGQNTSEVDAYIQKLKELNGMVVTTIFKNVYVNEKTPNERQRTGQSRLGNGDQYASGGTVKNTGLALVGEHGPELRFLNRGDYIATAEETRRLMQMSSGASGGGSASSAGYVQVAAGDSWLGQMIQYAFDRRLVQVFDGNGRPVSTKRR